MQVELRVVADGASAEGLDAQVAGLRRELRVARVTAVRTPTAPPDEAKADIGFVLGALTVTLGSTADLLPAIVQAVRHWVGDRASRRVIISLDGDTLDVSGVSAADQSRLVGAFLARHGAGPPAGA